MRKRGKDAPFRISKRVFRSRRARALEHFHCCSNVGVVRSHPCGKDKYAARMGHPELTLTSKMLYRVFDSSVDKTSPCPILCAFFAQRMGNRRCPSGTETFWTGNTQLENALAAWEDTRLLVPQRLDGVEVGGADGGDHSAHQAGDGKNHRGHNHRGRRNQEPDVRVLGIFGQSAVKRDAAHQS